MLDGALAAMECRTTAVHFGGDHSIVVGEVLGVTEPMKGDGEVGGEGGPLIYHSGRYRRLAAE
jgi:flavin reductase (DIM6/NTAB) family NADH-FMN oxidoreductase RutF